MSEAFTTFVIVLASAISEISCLLRENYHVFINHIRIKSNLSSIILIYRYILYTGQ